jgi:dienelactone hydrolase
MEYSGQKIRNLKRRYSMKSFIVIFLAISIFMLYGITYSDELTIEDIGRSFVSLLAKGDFARASNSFTKELAQAIPKETLESIWKGILSTLGKFNGIIDIKITEIQGYKVSILTCDFELGTLGIQIALDRESKIAGLYFLQPQFKATYKIPPYVTQDSYTEIEVTVESNGWKLPATLTLPRSEKTCPAVVLVHGSGPQDRDETVGPNKPFKDLALGLASKGIAVLRYEKRTRYYGEKALVEGFTVNEETIEDAISAIELLYQRKEIDKDRIFLLGHSLGGMLAPRIAERTDKLKGIIILAGTINDLLELIPKQAKYLASLDDKITEEEKREIEEMENQVNKVKSKKIGKNESILGAPGSYWLDLMSYDPLKTLKGMNIPVLILQGDRDFQVTLEEFNIWKEELKDKPNVSFKLCKGLNHLFISGEGKSGIEEYYKPGNIPEEVIEDIARWILSIQP